MSVEQRLSELQSKAQAVANECHRLGLLINQGVNTTDSPNFAGLSVGGNAVWHAGNLGADGWIPADEAWSYASTTAITVPSGAASRYQKGDKIKLVQGGATKYFYVVGVSDTVLVVAGGSNYAVANSAITQPHYSKAENPQGFPDWFNWQPTFTGFSANPTGIYKFRITGRSCTAVIRQDGTGTSNATTFTLTLPVTSASIANMYWGTCGAVTNNGIRQNVPGEIEVGANSNVADVNRTTAVDPWTSSGGKRLIFATLIYEI